MKKEPVPPPPIHTPGPNQEMSVRVTPLPHRQKFEQQGLATLPIHVFSPRTRLLFVTVDLANTQENGNMARTNPFAGSSGETVRTDTQQKRLEDPEEGWSFQRKKKKQGMPARILSPRQDVTQTLTHSPQPASTPGGKRGQTHSELHHTYFESLEIPVLGSQDSCKAWI
jgi:hypothetical protein